MTHFRRRPCSTRVAYDHFSPVTMLRRVISIPCRQNAPNTPTFRAACCEEQKGNACMVCLNNSGILDAATRQRCGSCFLLAPKQHASLGLHLTRDVVVGFGSAQLLVGTEVVALVRVLDICRASTRGLAECADLCVWNEAVLHGGRMGGRGSSPGSVSKSEVAIQVDVRTAPLSGYSRVYGEGKVGASRSSFT